jgi:glycosyltransferase involved in cell wall biosynthesis
MKICIEHVKGGSGVDVWAQNLCEGLQKSGVSCNLDLLSGIYQFCPGLIPLRKTTNDNVDVIQSNTWNGYGFKTETPLVVTEHHVVHDPVFNPYKTRGQKLFHRQVFKFEKKSLAVADAVTCVSRFTQKKLESVFDYHDSVMIYNGIDTSLFKPLIISRKYWNIPDTKKILFFSGTPSVRKGADLLPKIRTLLGDDYILLIASGSKKGFNGGRNNIRNLGSLPLAELINIYNICDIFLFPSRLEGFGLSVAEAMACGKPVVATNGSSLPELVVDGKGGFLCEMDNVKEFAAKIRYLAEDVGEREMMGRFNRERVQELFTIEKMVNNYIELYRSLI